MRRNRQFIQWSALLVHTQNCRWISVDAFEAPKGLFGYLEVDKPVIYCSLPQVLPKC